MELLSLYETAEKEKITIHILKENTPINGAFVSYRDNNIIAIKHNITHEKSVLAEELGHYYKDAVYNIHCNDIRTIERNEYRAKQFAYKILVPKDKLILLLKNQYNKYEIAEILDVSLELIELAYSYYIENNNN